MRCLTLLIAVAILCSPLQAEDPVETARSGLDQAKMDYIETVERAQHDLESAGDRAVKRIRSSAKSSVADQIARIEKIEKELREFSDFHKLPTDAALRNDVDKYRETTNKARLKCEKAFDALAQRYVAAKDDSKAKMTLEEKSRFFQRGLISGVFDITTNPPYGHATLELTPAGEFKQVQDKKWTFPGTWSQISKNELLLKYADTKYGTIALKILDEDHLEGVNTHADGKTYGWRLIRQSAATFPPGDFYCTTVPDEGRWTLTINKDGTCSNTSPNGNHVDRGNWQQFGSEIRFEFCYEGYYDKPGSTGVLKFEDNDHLTGYNRLIVSRQEWAWTLVRKSPDDNKK